MGFKFFQKEECEFSFITLTQPYHFTPANVEFCFQFDDEEPVAFATGPNECTIRLSPTHDGNMIFNDNGRVFKLFARERQ
jgi:hypothetical protein